MNKEAFWDVIASYNTNLKIVNFIIFILLIVVFILTLFTKYKFILKLYLGALNLYIGIVFFGIYGTEIIQKAFALPLYLSIGVLFIYEGIKNRKDTMQKITILHAFMIALYILYPLISELFGNVFPRTVTYIMPCPVIFISMTLYSMYCKKNKILLILLTIWGLTGVKAIPFHAYEDLILLLGGIYYVYLVIIEFKKSKQIKN